MMEKKLDKGLLLVLLATVLLGIIGFLAFGCRKDIWFCDEVYTYEIANRLGRPNVLAESQKWLSGYDVKMYFGASYRQLLLKEVLADFPKDNVPLYYVLLRIFSVIFVGRATKWIGLAVNFLFFVPFLVLIFGVSYQVCKKKMGAMLLTLAVSFHPFLLSQMMTIRMYCPFLVFVVASFILVVSLKPEGKNNWWHWLLLLLVVTGGLLTHFHYWFFIGFLSLYYCCYLIQKRRWRHLFGYVADMASALVVATFIFPDWVVNITQGHGGAGIANLIDFSHLGGELLYFLSALAELFSTRTLHWVVVLVLLVIFFGIFFYGRRGTKAGRVVWLGVLSCVSTMLFIAHTVDEQAVRYFWAPAGLLFLLTVYVLFEDGSCLLLRIVQRKEMTEQKKNVLFSRTGLISVLLFLLLDVFLVCSDIQNVMYLANRPADTRKVLESYADVPWVVYADTVDNTLDYEMFCSFFDFTIPEHLCRVAGDDRPYADEILSAADQVILYINEKKEKPAAAVQYLEQCRKKKHSTIKQVAQSTYCSVYLVEW